MSIDIIYVNYLDLLPDDLMEKINKTVNEAKIYERKKKRIIQKEKQRIAKQYKYCEKLFDKAYCKYNNIYNFEF